MSAALARFMSGCRKSAVGYAYGLTRSMQDSEDAVQESFRRLFLNKDALDGRRAPSAWYFTTLRNVCLDRRKAVARGPDSLDALAEEPTFRYFVDGEVGLLEAMEKRETLDAVRRAFAGLKPALRHALVLCDVEGFKYKAAARALAVPLGTVRSRLFRARQALRRRYLAAHV